MNVICAKCRRPVYRDWTAGRGHGSSFIPLRDEIDDSTICPEGDRHVSEIVHDVDAVAS